MRSGDFSQFSAISQIWISEAQDDFNLSGFWPAGGGSDMTGTKEYAIRVTHHSAIHCNNSAAAKGHQTVIISLREGRRFLKDLIEIMTSHFERQRGISREFAASVAVEWFQGEGIIDIVHLSWRM
jgi:hypothetical protein